MSAIIDDGGPAFARNGHIVKPDGKLYNELQFAQCGMSLRDYIAIHASEKDIEHHIYAGGSKETHRPRTRVQARYHFADAMIQARKEGGK